MARFFDTRATGYDEHMRHSVTDFERYYDAVAAPIIPSGEAVDVLDLGCGTGLEIRGILGKVPNARFKCIDMSAKMLEVLVRRYGAYRDQIEVSCGSYLETDFGRCSYDYVVSVMTMHHFEYNVKRDLYRRIRQSLKPGGLYIEGDYVVTPDKERRLLCKHKGLLPDQSDRKLYHIDIPFSLQTQRELFREAGFGDFELIWRRGEQLVYAVRS